MFPVSVAALSHAAQIHFSPFINNEAVQSQLPWQLWEAPACPPVHTSLTKFVLFPIIPILFPSSSAMQNEWFSWLYLRSSLTTGSGSFTPWKPLCAVGQNSGEKRVFAFRHLINWQQLSVQQHEIFIFRKHSFLFGGFLAIRASCDPPHSLTGWVTSWNPAGSACPLQYPSSIASSPAQFFLSKNKQNLFYLCSLCRLFLKILIFKRGFQPFSSTTPGGLLLISTASTTRRIFLLEFS